MIARLKVTIDQFSDKGVKDENQDSMGYSIPTNLVMLETKGVASAVADGVSASTEAKQASQACITGFMADYFSTPDSWSVKQSGGKVLTAINTWLHGQNQQYQGVSCAFASTFSALIIKSTTAHLFHVGDSRVYLYRHNELEQLTTDHRIRLEEDREYLGRAFGVDYCLDIDYKTLTVEEGDVFLLTTDGVHDVLTSRDLKTRLAAADGNIDGLAEQICQQAIQHNSVDNVSCQLLRIEQLPSQDPNEVFAQLSALPFPPELEEGMVMDGYRIVRELHASSTSQLYLAVEVDSQQTVVIKTPSVNFEDDPAYLERFQLEEWIGRRINHAHVVKTIEQKTPRHFLYYVLEYIDGKTLEQWLDDVGTLDLNTVRKLIPQIISGLRAFHRLDMIHQDLKPGNIMITADGLVKLIDFGSTKIAGIADISTPVERCELLGTKYYTAPEYLMGENGTVRAEQFSLGCIVFEMLSGKLPYGKKVAGIHDSYSAKRLVYHGLANYDTSLPHWVDKAIRKAVHVSPAMRYDVLSAFEADLMKPNPAYLREEQLPLLTRNPVGFWQTISVVLLLVNLILWFLLSQST